MEFAFIVAKLVTGQETVLTSTADSTLFKLAKQDTKGNCQTLPSQGKTVLQNLPASQISLKIF